MLLPTPRQFNPRSGQFRLNPNLSIRLASPEMLFSARRLQAALQNLSGPGWQLSAGWSLPPQWVGIDLILAPDEVRQPQGYRLSIQPERISARAHDLPGLFYAVCTLIQLLQSEASSAKPELPCLEIQDWPDFSVRGVMLDISRDKVPTLETLFQLVDQLASWKVNQFQLYTEHTFAYQNHTEVWQAASPITGDDILALDAYCRERFIELVPNQSSFGHLKRWLIHPRYSPLAETMNEFSVPWGKEEGPFSLCPTDPGSLELLRSLYDELLPHFSSRLFNVDCDETFDLGQGRSKAECEARGTGPVYLDFLLKIYAEVSRRGKTMMFWGDIINLHPELIPLLPRDTIALPWGYEASHPFDVESARFEASGIPYYVCPGTSSWDSLGGRTTNALANLQNAAENGLKHGALGFLNTDWGDFGHWQVLPVSYIGLAAGAAYSWCLETNRDLDMAAAVSIYAFGDPSGSMGKVYSDLGNVYLIPGIVPHNSSVLFWALQWPLSQIASYPEKLNYIAAAQAAGHPLDGIHVEGSDFSPNAVAARFENTLAAIDQALSNLPAQQMARPDRDLILRETANTARLMRFAARRALNALESGPSESEMLAEIEEFLPEYRSIWLARNRPGGLDDSAARFEIMREENRE